MKTYTELCDRCHKKLNRRVWPPIIRVKKVLRIELRGHDPYDYSDHEKELCQDCYNALVEFLLGGEGVS